MAMNYLSKSTRSLGTPKYTYMDAKDGTKYCVSTETNDGDEAGTRECGADLRYVVADGGDHTMCDKRELGAPVMGSGRG